MAQIRCRAGPRHAYEDRWPSALEAKLGGKVRVIAEGLGGRTTVHDDWYADADRNGARILPTLLRSHCAARHGDHHAGHQRSEAVPRPHRASRPPTACAGWCRSCAVTLRPKSRSLPEIIIVAPPSLCETDASRNDAAFRRQCGDRGIEELCQMVPAAGRGRGRGVLRCRHASPSPTPMTACISMRRTRAPSAKALVPLVNEPAGAVSDGVVIRPARKSDASEIALLVNIARMAGRRRAGRRDKDAEGTYDPIEVGRLRHAERRQRLRLAQRHHGRGRRRGRRHAARLSRTGRVRARCPTETPSFCVPIDAARGGSRRATGSSACSACMCAGAGKGVGSQLLEAADARGARERGRGRGADRRRRKRRRTPSL